jgi:hypothetical protein
MVVNLAVGQDVVVNLPNGAQVRVTQPTASSPVVVHSSDGQSIYPQYDSDKFTQWDRYHWPLRKP